MGVIDANNSKAPWHCSGPKGSLHTPAFQGVAMYYYHLLKLGNQIKTPRCHAPLHSQGQETHPFPFLSSLFLYQTRYVGLTGKYRGF